MKNKVKMANDAPDNKGRSTGLVVHVFPQEKLYIVKNNDMFGLVENGKL